MTNVQRISKAYVILASVVLFSNSSLAECGIASYYSSGKITANGERYDHMGISAAHKSLPFGTVVVVKDQKTGHNVTVRINDRGPFIAGRIIDLSTGAKNALGMDGLAPVCLEVVSYGDGQRHFAAAHAKQPLAVKAAYVKAAYRNNASASKGRAGRVHVAYAKNKRHARRHHRVYAHAAGSGQQRHYGA